MPEDKKVTRKLSAILSADVKGYSLLMADDEVHTIDTLKAYRLIISDLVSKHSGRIVDSPGDNILAEFRSSVDAVDCAAKIQKNLDKENSKYADDKKVQFRIGVNVGDVIQDGDRIYGNGVNVASRIEGLADAGGVCISRNAYDHVKNKLTLGYEYIGEHSVKNIKDPVRVYKVLTNQEEAGKLIGENPQRYRKKWPWLAVATVAFLIGVIVWQFYYEKLPPIEAASVEKMAFPLPEKPSIAVLPFKNLSDDPSQDYIGVGISENIISALSNISDMFVIYSDSTSTYMGKSVKIQKVSEEFGVRYVLEGSAQKSGNRVRVSAQLIDATTGQCLWSEKYDRELQNLFDLQDEITHKIIVELQVTLTEGEQARVSQTSTTNLEAWSYANGGLALWMRPSKENNAEAMELFKKAVELDPNYVWAWVRLAWTHVVAADSGWSPSPSEHFKMAVEISKKVLVLDESDSDVHALLGLVYRKQGQYKLAIDEGEKSLILGPTNAQAHVLHAVSMNIVGRFDEAIELVKRAMRLHPYYPAYYLPWLGGAYRMTGRYEDALTVYNQLLDRSRKGEYPIIAPHLYLAEIHAELGKEDVARTHAAEVLKINSGFSLEDVSNVRTYRYEDPAHLERRLNALRKAGIPEHEYVEALDKPSIAVLPFDNLSDDQEQEYFIDGIAEDIITALSKTDQLLVIARNSTFTYKNKPTNVKKIAEELDVRYVLEGSVRKNEDRVRITAQLIDALTGHHLWAERYDRNLGDIFALQDEITLAIIRAMQVELTDGEQARVTGRDTENLEAYLKAINAHDQFHLMNKEGSIKAKQLANEALMLDPNYAFPYATLANAHMLDVWFGYSESREESMRIAAEAVQKALSLDNSDPKVYHAVTNLYIMQGQYEKAISSAEQGIKIGPSNAEAYLTMGNVLMMFYRNREAIPFFEQAIRLDPYPSSVTFRSLGSSYMGVGRYEDAVMEFKKALQLKPDDMFTHLELASTYVRLGREDEAKIEAKEVIRITPAFSLNEFAKSLPDPEEYPETADYIESLRKAGLPD